MENLKNDSDDFNFENLLTDEGLEMQYHLVYSKLTPNQKLKLLHHATFKYLRATILGYNWRSQQANN